MTAKIIIAADETIVCPKCTHHFPLDQGITRQTIERYRTATRDAKGTVPEMLRKILTKAEGA
jgi:hypothetical protein